MLFAMSLFVCLAASTRPAVDATSCVRVTGAGQRQIVERGLQQSPTFARVVTALCRTDVIAYVELSLTLRAHLSGTCQVVAFTPRARFVRIRLNARSLNVLERIATLSHELQHALEIGTAKWVRNDNDVLALQRMMWPADRHSAAAVRAGTDTLRELFGPQVPHLAAARSIGRE